MSAQVPQLKNSASAGLPADTPSQPLPFEVAYHHIEIPHVRAHLSGP